LVNGSSSVLWRLLGTHQVVGNLAEGGIDMDWTTIMAVVIAAVLVVYLTLALLKPEIFS
jgi:K+-transporting ATPase KdpF subunit